MRHSFWGVRKLFCGYSHSSYLFLNRDVCRAKMFLNLRRNGIGKTNDLWDLGCSYSSLRENEGTQFGMCTTVCEENKLVVVFVILSNLVYLILNFRVLYIFCCFLVSYLIKIMDFCLNNLFKIFNKIHSVEKCSKHTLLNFVLWLKPHFNSTSIRKNG